MVTIRQPFHRCACGVSHMYTVVVGTLSIVVYGVTIIIFYDMATLTLPHMIIWINGHIRNLRFVPCSTITCHHTTSTCICNGVKVCCGLRQSASLLSGRKCVML